MLAIGAPAASQGLFSWRFEFPGNTLIFGKVFARARRDVGAGARMPSGNRARVSNALIFISS
jgi:hypothetical protein